MDTPAEQTNAPLSPTPQNPAPKKGFLSAIVALILLLLIGVGVLAYAQFASNLPTVEPVAVNDFASSTDTEPLTYYNDYDYYSGGDAVDVHTCFQEPNDDGLGHGYLCYKEGFGAPDFGHGHGSGDAYPYGNPDWVDERYFTPFTGEDMVREIGGEHYNRAEMIIVHNDEHQTFRAWLAEMWRENKVAVGNLAYEGEEIIDWNMKPVQLDNQIGYQVGMNAIVGNGIVAYTRIRTAVPLYPINRNGTIADETIPEHFMFVDCYFDKPELEATCENFLAKVFFSAVETTRVE